VSYQFVFIIFSYSLDQNISDMRPAWHHSWIDTVDHDNSEDMKNDCEHGQKGG
jgi:hypothetical protein